MCTAATYKTRDFYFGRTLDYEFFYGDEIVFTPRAFPFDFRHTARRDTHYAMLGMAHVADGYPLYYDAMNEKGLCAAGLNFVGNAVYTAVLPGKENVAQFELIPWLLGSCASVAEVRTLLAGATVTYTPFSDKFPPAQLHWLIADRNEAITVESTATGLHVYDNPAGVLTNNPPFDLQMFHLNDYMQLSPKQPENRFSDALALRTYSRGMGALGLPGDLSSASRFVRAAFVRAHSASGEDETASVSQFFHILGAVEQPRGCCEVAEGKYEITIYTSCCNADRGIYYYTTYDNSRISAVDMHAENLDAKTLARFAPVTESQILYQNRHSSK
ncbi:MAG: linear amide C-N hydrolase [Clostridiales bacterium]|nr:linear amide C-N hydrolase [Clostridiales bacterium]